MKIKEKFFFVLLLLLSFSGFAQEVQVLGVIVDEETHLPLAGANVLVKGTFLGTASGRDGNFALKVNNGSYQLQVSYSGYQTMRIELAKILLQRPNLILLDEPTNHLDIESIQWLEDYLKDYTGAVILISHDRAFLDNVTNRTVEIVLGKIHDYKVSYSQYVDLRKERREQQLSAYRNQQKMIEDTEDFIERFRYKATKSVQVQSRIKQLDKVDRIEIDEEDNTALHIKFPPAPRSGQIVMEASNLTKAFGDHVIFSEVSLKIERGEKVAFVGRNGEGKTTLSRIAVGDLDATVGYAKLGYNVSLGYFAQNQDDLMDGNMERTPLS